MERYHYIGFWGCECVCGLEITKRGQFAVVTLTELPDNEGTSITNMYEQLATQVYKERLSDIRPQNIFWIEHYIDATNPATGENKDETFDLVALEFVGGEFQHPQWTHLSEREDLYKSLRITEGENDKHTSVPQN